jgi:predicted nucleic acid-binding protein
MSSAPNSRVIAWIDKEKPWNLYTTATSIAEIAYGIAILPHGNRRQLLQKEFELSIKQGFDGMVLSFSTEAAEMYGTLRAYRKLSGRPIGIADAQIAATAKVNGAAIATRNTKDFSDFGIELLNPYD